jgi:TM2 domain-containing membrane protein YozV
MAVRRVQSRGGPSVGQDNKEEAKTMSRPGAAALLSFLIPGVGQLYNGDILRGVFWLIITPGFWIGTGGLLGWVCHFIAAATAHSRAEEKELRRLPAL